MTAFNPHEYLNSFHNYEAQLHNLQVGDFNLDRVTKLLNSVGDPAKNLKIVHVAGTKGKGSTCIFLARILQEAGYSVGLYTSPHLHRVNERIRILNKANLNSKDDFCGSISDEEMTDVLLSIKPFVDKIQQEGSFVTYFELLTIAALVYFSKCRVDVVILETGLGGRLDATNAVDSTIAVITPVSLDHTQILGATITQIAFEKAGIIKNPKQQVVLAPQNPETLDVILKRAHDLAISPVIVMPKKYQDFKIALKGKHQIVNAATAVETANILKTLGFNISDNAMAQALQHVRWPGRFEVLRKSPDLVIDSAHNDASAQALAQTIEDEYPQQRVILVLGISKDKDIKAVCEDLKDHVDHVILTKSQHPRSHIFSSEEAKKHFGEVPVEIINDVPQAIRRALSRAKPQDVIVVTGSIFIAAEASHVSI